MLREEPCEVTFPSLGCFWHVIPHIPIHAGRHSSLRATYGARAHFHLKHFQLTTTGNVLGVSLGCPTLSSEPNLGLRI